MITLVLGRISSLARHHAWRNDVLDKNIFPAACGSWAEERGCARVVMDADGCKDASETSKSQTLYKATF
jgi:hypothetical protein